MVWTDADMTYPNERIPELVAIIATLGLLADLIVRSRSDG